MEKNTFISEQEVHEMLKARLPSHTLENKFYNREDILHHELKHIWYKSWVFVGHPVEFEKTGDYFTLNIGEYLVLVIRTDKKGTIKAFINDSLKNSNPFALDPRGFLPNPTAKLKTLKPIACENSGGHLFVSLSENPQDINGLRKRMEDYAAPHNMKELKLASEATIIEKGNWKLVFENNRECYHCASNHPELTITFPEDPSITGVPGIKPPQALLEHWARCESMDMPSKFLLSDEGEYRLARVPLLNNYTSYTMDGGDAVKKRLCDAEDTRIGSLLFFHYPSTWNHYLGDQVVSFRIVPLSAETTLLTTKWLVHKDAVEGIDYDLSDLRHVWDNTNLQDRHVIEQNQLGINSPDYQPGPYSQHYESGVIQFVDWYSDHMIREISVK